MKKKKNEMTELEIIKTLDALYTAASVVKGRAAVKLFLRDLLTESERIMLGRRIIIARLILQGETYDKIRERLGVGYGTISRVEKWLQDEFPGYEQAISELEKEMGKRTSGKHPHSKPFSLAALKRRYPLHFLLFPEPKPKLQNMKKHE